MAQKNDVPVPNLNDAGTDYEDYKIRARKWCRLTKTKKRFQAEMLQMGLGKKPFGITKRIPDDILMSENGVQALLNKLDEHYIPDKLQHTMSVWDKFMSIKRKQNQLIIDHIQLYMDAFENFQDIDAKMECPDTIVAMLLLTSCNLKDEDKKIVTAQMDEPPNTKNLIGILKRVMTADKTAMEKDEDEIYKTFSPDEATTSTTLYTENNRRAYRPARRDRTERSDSWRGEDYRRNQDSRRGEDSRRNHHNPPGPDGSFRRCHVCDSIWHYVNACPEVKRLKKECRNKKENKDSDVHLSM